MTVNYRCRECGTPGTADDAIWTDAECPHDWCDGIIGPEHYEVTVPLTLKVEPSGVVKSWSLAGFGGFFSEAEEAGGVWDPADERWTEDHPGIQDAAWDWVIEHMPDDQGRTARPIAAGLESWDGQS